jgi:putative flippase GtrA
MSSHDFRDLLTQMVRYGVVGVLNNLWAYLLYLLLTWQWLDPKMAVSILYPVGALTGYFAHAKYSFAYSGGKSKALLRFIVAHVVGYIANLSMLFLLVDVCGYPHPGVQALAIVTVAGVLFVLFRYYVFSGTTKALL